MIAGLEALDPARLGDANLIYTFHFYEPYVFSHQGAPWMSGEPIYRYLNAVPWPASAGAKQKTLAAVAARMAADRATPAAEKRDIARRPSSACWRSISTPIRTAASSSAISRASPHGRTRHGVARSRILLGEFGALRSDERYVAAPAADRARYIRDVREVCEAAGMPWAFWNLFDGMGLTIDDWSRAFDPAIVAALGLRAPRRSLAPYRPREHHQHQHDELRQPERLVRDALVGVDDHQEEDHRHRGAGPQPPRDLDHEQREAGDQECREDAP